MDKKFMIVAIETALRNIDSGGGPFGAVIVRDGKIISRSGNQVTLRNDPTAHAEMIVIRKASVKLGKWDLSDCELYCTCEPCPMCLGAIYWAHIPKVYYGSNREDAEHAGFDDSFIYDEITAEHDKRRIKMQNLMKGEALKCFEKWKKLPDKQLY